MGSCPLPLSALRVWRDALRPYDRWLVRRARWREGIVLFLAPGSLFRRV